MQSSDKLRPFAKRGAIILLATALGAIVLFLTLLANPSVPSRSARTPVEVDRDTRWNPVNPREQGDPTRPLGEMGARRGVIDWEDRRGQLFQIFFDALRPLPQGRLQMNAPRTLVHLKPHHRVLEVRSDEGTFVAPENRPRSGVFSGNVVLTLFECPDQQTIDYSNASPHIVLQLFLEDATFDLELGRITSDGTVHMTSLQFDFQGEGLDLNYNQVRRRIERLEIAHGRQLRLAGRASDDRASETSSTAARRSEAPQVMEEKRAAAQYYLASLYRNVRITGRGLNVADCYQLDVIFGLGDSGTQEQLLERMDRSPASGTPAASPQTARTQSLAADQVGVSGTAVAIGEPRPRRTMLPEGENDVLVTWEDRFTVVPLEQPPAEIAGPHDMTFTLLGRPLRVTTDPQDMVITAPQLRYFADAGRLRLVGNERQAVVFDAENWGVLNIPEIVVDVAEERALFLGQGRWRAHGDRNVIAQVEPEHQMGGRYDRLPPGTEINWHEGVDIAFYLSEGRSDMKLGQIKAIKRATFNGDVSVYHPTFDLRSETLTLGLSPPEAGGAIPSADGRPRQEVSDLSATGYVHLVSRAATPQSQLHLQTDKLVIGMENDGRGLRPAGLLADGNVKARQRDLTLRSDSLMVNLAKDDDVPLRLTMDDEPTAGATRDRDKLDIRSITASDRVFINLADQGVDIYADLMIAEGDQIELFGDEGRLTRMINKDGMLTARHFVLNQRGQSLHAIGAGTLDVFGRDDAADDDLRESLLTTSWQKNMHFNNRTNYCQFLGDVVCLAKRGTQFTELRAQDLRLDFVEVDPKLRQDDSDLRTARKSQLMRQSMTAGNRALRMVTARETVRFEAANFRAFSDPMPQTRVSIQGDLMTFDSLLEQVQVVGKGRMGFEDYRPKPSMRENALAASQADPMVQLSGRGVTVFTWMGQLDLDAFYNDMKVEKQVQMYHLPLGAKPEEGVQLDCRSFLADLEDTGGLGVLAGPSPPRPALRAIKANGDVRVLRQDREIYTDALDYAHANQTVILRANPGQRVRVLDLKSGSTIPAQQFIWDLRNNRMEVVEPGRSTVPVPR